MFSMVFYSLTLRRIHARSQTRFARLSTIKPVRCGYSKEQVFKKITELGMTNKRASTEAPQAFEPRNTLKFRRQSTVLDSRWSLGWYRSQRRRRLLDIDEFVIALQKINPNSGHAHTSIRSRKPGNYCRDTKLTCLLLSGDSRWNPKISARKQQQAQYS
jgi:hypothetical protein